MSKKKGELPSGSVRRQIYDHSEPVFDSEGNPVLDPKTGKQKKKRIYISVTGGSAKEAEQKKASIIADKESYEKPSEMTLYEAIDRYIESNSSLLSPSSIAGYRKIQRNAFRGIIYLRLSELNNEKLRVAVNEECARPKNKKGSGTICAKTVRSEWELIRSVLHRYAKNIDTTVLLPQVVTKKHQLSTPEQLYEMVKGDPIELPVMMAMWLSFTASELLGLTKSNSISSDGKYITIDEVIVIDEHQQAVSKKTGKQPKRNRTLEIPEYIKGLIDAVPGDRLVTISGAALSHRFARLIKKSGLPHMTFHDLRHVNASVMTILHVPDKYAQERGGWHSDHILKSVYQQTIAPERVAVDAKIDQYFSEIVREDKMPNKYSHYLALFDLEDTPEHREDFFVFCEQNQIKCNTNATRNLPI